MQSRANDRGSSFAREKRDRGSIADHKTAQVVYASGMIEMLVGQKNGVDVVEAKCEALLPEIGPYIDKDRESVDFDETGAAESLVSGIGRRANLAAARWDGNARRRPRFPVG